MSGSHGQDAHRAQTRHSALMSDPESPSTHNPRRHRVALCHNMQTTILRVVNLSGPALTSDHCHLRAGSKAGRSRRSPPMAPTRVTSRRAPSLRYPPNEATHDRHNAPSPSILGLGTMQTTQISALAGRSSITLALLPSPLRTLPTRLLPFVVPRIHLSRSNRQGNFFR